MACFGDLSRAGILVGGLLVPLNPAPNDFFRSLRSALSVVTIEISSLVVAVSVRSVTEELVVAAVVVEDEEDELEEDVVAISSSIFVVCKVFAVWVK